MEHMIITIGREFGSGGLDVGKLLGEELGIKCYDKELLQIASKESGICEEIFYHHDEKPTNSFLYALVMDSYSMGGYAPSSYLDMPLNHKVFLAQFEAIRTLAKEQSCIIVGRCGDYALEDSSNCFNIFIHAKEDFRAKRVQEAYQITYEKAKDMLRKTDKQRASYYNYYSNKKWGDSRSYHLTLDSSVLGIKGCVDVIKNALQCK